MQLGSYDIVKKIGEGGFGRTYLARHRLLDEPACIKQNINLNSKDVEMLRKEAKLLWKIHHYSLPALRDFFEAPDGSYVLAMSYIPGKSLDKIIEKHKAVNPEDVAWVTERMIDALYYLHHKGIIHGDIKPPNVIVQPREHNAILVDYGLSSLHPTATSKPEGFTPVFAAPEILDGKPPLPESDLYSLGLTMIYLLGGDPVAKKIPDHVPAPFAEFCADFVRYNPVDRPNWDQNLVARLSDVRLEAFGRRHSL